jgi:hypothetical protein
MTKRKTRYLKTRSGRRVPLQVREVVDGGNQYYVRDAWGFAVLVFIPTK